MKIQILTFGVARDIVGAGRSEMELPEDSTLADLRETITAQFPALRRLHSLRLAVNTNYAEDTTALRNNDEVALIPPVSGG